MFKSFAASDKKPITRRKQAATPAEPAVPGTLQWAVRLMLAGAAASTVFLVFGVIVTASERSELVNALLKWDKTQPKAKQLTLTQINSYVTVSFVSMIIIGLIAIALWLWMARMNTAGRKWARYTASVLFVLWTYYTYVSIGATRGAATLIASMIIVLVIWLIGMVSLFFLWRPDSTAYFRDQSSSR